MKKNFLTSIIVLSLIGALGAGVFLSKKLKELSVQQQVIEFLENSDVKDSYEELKITNIKYLPRDYVKVSAEYLTKETGHPFDDPNIRHAQAIEHHQLDLIIEKEMFYTTAEKDPKFSFFKIIYARDIPFTRDEEGQLLIDERAEVWNFITRKYLENNHDFNKKTPERDIELFGRTYAPVIYVKVPEISDWERGSLVKILEKDGYEIYGFSTNKKIKNGYIIGPADISNSIVIPEGTYFWLWSAKD